MKRQTRPLSNQLPSRQHSSWAEEMNIWDPQLDDDDPTSETMEINVVPVTEWTNKFLTEAFTQKMSGVDRQKLRRHYTLPQNELTMVPFLDVMMSLECLSKVKSKDHSLFTLQKWY